MTIVVTGGTGFLGKNLQKIHPEYVYLSSKDYDLTESVDCVGMIDELKPDAIIHLAGFVGGIKDNSSRQAEYFYKNVAMNTNLIHEAYLCGVPRMLCALSTCAFPDVVSEYPFTEKDIFNGPPAETNFSYGYAKRMMHVQCMAYRKQYGANYSTFCPCNLYGPGDHFNSDKGHFVADLVTKFFSCDSAEFLGTGAPLRQFLYVKDLAWIIPQLLENHNSDLPLIVAPNENLSIKELIEQALEELSWYRYGLKPFNYSFTGQLDGQYRKDGSNKELLKLIGDFSFIPFKAGIQETAISYAHTHV